MKVKLIEKDGYKGIMPTRAHFDDAGIDFYTPIGFDIPPRAFAIVNLRVAVQIPVGYCGVMVNKSGLNINRGIITTAGIIDSSYRGSIQVRITNTGMSTYSFERGDKISQMVIVPVGLFDLEEVDALDPSVSGREDAGFGSTGK